MSDDDKLSFLRDDKGRFAPKEGEPAEPTSAAPESPEPAAPETPEPTPAKAETPAPAAPPISPSEPPPVSQPVPVTPPPVQVPPGYVPLAAQLDEREKRQRLERDLEDYRRKYEEATKKPVELDPVTDPDGFRSHFERELARTRWDTITTMSRNWAMKNHGQAGVEAAEEAVKIEVQQNPGFFQQLQSQADPYDFAVRWHKRKQFTDAMGELAPDEWVKKRALEMGLIQPQTASPVAPAGAASPQPATPLPRPSLATAPAASGNTPKAPTGPGVAFDEVFAK